MIHGEDRHALCLLGALRTCVQADKADLIFDLARYTPFITTTSFKRVCASDNETSEPLLGEHAYFAARATGRAQDGNFASKHRSFSLGAVSDER